MRMASIYVLLDNSGVRYVGKTVLPLKTRLSSHLSVARNRPSTALHRWLNARPEPPTVVCVDEVPEETWEAIEREWVAFFRAVGCDLLNGNGGGAGRVTGKRSPEFGEKMSRALRGRKASEEHRRAMSEAMRQRWSDPDYRARVLAARETPAAREARVANRRAPEKMPGISAANRRRFARPGEREKVSATMVVRRRERYWSTRKGRAD